MDPDANLNEQLRLSSRLQFQVENDHSVEGGDIIRLTELVIALDGWLSNGGFAPAKWKRA